MKSYSTLVQTMVNTIFLADHDPNYFAIPKSDSTINNNDNNDKSDSELTWKDEMLILEDLPNVESNFATLRN